MGQCRNIHGALQLYRDAQVVHWVSRIELMQEPQTLLCEGEWQLLACGGRPQDKVHLVLLRCLTQKDENLGFTSPDLGAQRICQRSFRGAKLQTVAVASDPYIAGR